MIPQPHWKKITTEEAVHIPHPDGESRAEIIKVTVEAWQDPEDGEIYLDASALKKLDDVRARHMGLMLPEEIRELRLYLGLSQSEISRLLRIGEKSWTRWETGRSRPTHGYNLLLNALSDGRIDLNYLELRAQGAEPMRPTLPSKGSQTHQIHYRVGSSTDRPLPEVWA